MNRLPLLGHAADDVIARRQGHRITAWRFLADVERMAAKLPDLKNAVNLCEDHYLFLVGMAAAWTRGQQVLLPPSRSPEAVSGVIGEHGEAYCLLDEAGARYDAVRSQRTTPQRYVESEEPVSIGEYRVPQLEADLAAVTLYTSGSTGSPVGHRKRWRELAEGVRLTGVQLGRDKAPGTDIVATVPAQHMFGLETCIMATLVDRLTLLAERPFFPEDVRRAMQDAGPLPLLVTSPLHLRACVEANLEWPAPRFVLTATAPLDAELAAAAEQAMQCPVMEIYGSTETGAVATRRTATDTAWLPLEGVSITGGEEGVVVHASHLVQTAHLTDIVHRQPDGRFTLQGRVGDLVKIAGNRISLSELNRRLLAIPGVVDGAFLAPDAQGGTQRLTAVVVAPGVDDGTIVAALRECVDPVFLPRPLLRADHLPRGETGKLSRAELVSLVEGLRRGAK